LYIIYFTSYPIVKTFYKGGKVIPVAFDQRESFWQPGGCFCAVI